MPPPGARVNCVRSAEGLASYMYDDCGYPWSNTGTGFPSEVAPNPRL